MTKLVGRQINGNNIIKIILFVGPLLEAYAYQRVYIMTLNILALILLFTHTPALALGPFSNNKQLEFLETNRLNALDLLMPIPTELINHTYDHANDRRLREFLINQCAPHILREVFKPMSMREIQAQGSCIRAIFSKPMQTYSTNNPQDPKWSLPIISLEQQILLMKLEYAQQQHEYVWLAKEWLLVFRSLPSIFYLRYVNIIFVYDDFVDDNQCVIL